jgi:hypothetical protein
LTTSLANYAAQNPIDLVIMGTAGAGGWHEALLGSQAQQVVRQVRVPVVTIHQQATIAPIHNLLWVADFAAANQPEDTIAAIKILQQLFGSRLHLLQIVGRFTPGRELPLADLYYTTNFHHLNLVTQLSF